MPASPDADVVLVGVHGHGRWHLENIARLRASGAPVRLVGICDTRPPAPDLQVLGDHVCVSDRLDALLETVRPDVTIVCTPIHTHADLALLAAQAGSHILLEKPPTSSLSEFDGLVSGVERTSRACQVGFQSLGSHALGYVRALLAEGALGEVVGIGAAGAWQRDASYYGRARWAGRRTLDGVPVVDGALTNPFAHATATALAIDAGGAIDGGIDDEELREIDVELYRANPIDADDTSCLRLVTARGTTITVAVTLCAERQTEPYVVVHGARGRIVLFYTTGRVRLEVDGQVTVTDHGSTDLLMNLVDSLRDPSVPLLVPLRSTRPFMQVLEAVRVAPDPVEIPERYRGTDTSGPHPRAVVPGIDDAVTRSARDLAPLSALGLPWARPAGG